MQSRLIGTPRVQRILPGHLGGGRGPAMPDMAPWLSLISIILT
jgi:hypothetical protein